ncbi:MAG: hypothetical protein ABEH81_11450 [Halopenitus sp.]
MSDRFDDRDAPDQTDGPVTSLSELYRNPTAAPLATLAATLILGAFGYQAVFIAQQTSWWMGGLVLLTCYLAYRIARVGWRFENEFIRAELRAEGVDDAAASGPPADD